MSLQDLGTRSLQIVSGASNTTFDGINTFTVQLPAAGLITGKDEVCCKSLVLYYSWSNVSAAKGNNLFSYTWPGDRGTAQQGKLYPCVMADGAWSYTDMLAYLRQIMHLNGHFLTDGNGQSIYYITFVANPVLYCISFTVTPLPTTLPAGWSGTTNLSAAGGYSPQFVVPAGSSVLFGLSTGSYPAASATALYQINSGVPQISDVTSLNIVSSMVDNSSLSLNPKVLMSFSVPSSQLPGSLIQLSPQNLDWVPMQKQITLQTIVISLVDQLMRPVIIRDPQGFVAILNLRKRQ